MRAKRKGPEPIEVDGVAFHRVVLSPNDELSIRAQSKPVAMWVPSGYEVVVRTPRGVVLDLAEVVQHHDVVSMDLRLRQKDREVKRHQRLAKRARRRLRRLERVGQS